MSSQPGKPPRTARARSAAAGRYQWTDLTNTTMAVFMSSLDGMIILIALPAIFNGIHLDPLAPDSSSPAPSPPCSRPCSG
ncbi:MAG TPA: hypothetical protein VGM12_14160 [Trebonia sp.]